MDISTNQLDMAVGISAASGNGWADAISEYLQANRLDKNLTLKELRQVAREHCKTTFGAYPHVNIMGDLVCKESEHLYWKVARDGTSYIVPQREGNKQPVLACLVQYDSIYLAACDPIYDKQVNKLLNILKRAAWHHTEVQHQNVYRLLVEHAGETIGWTKPNQQGISAKYVIRGGRELPVMCLSPILFEGLAPLGFPESEDEQARSMGAPETELYVWRCPGINLRKPTSKRIQAVVQKDGSVELSEKSPKQLWDDWHTE